MAVAVLAALRLRNRGKSDYAACLRDAVVKYDPAGMDQISKLGLRQFLTDYENGEQPVDAEVQWVMHNADLADGRLTVWAIPHPRLFLPPPHQTIWRTF